MTHIIASPEQLEWMKDESVRKHLQIIAQQSWIFIQYGEDILHQNPGVYTLDRIRVSPPYLQYRSLAQCSRTSTAKGKQRGLSLIADHGFPINRTTKAAHELNVRRGCLFVASCKGGEVTMVETCQNWASRDATITAGETLEPVSRQRYNDQILVYVINGYYGHPVRKRSR